MKALSWRFMLRLVLVPIYLAGFSQAPRVSSQELVAPASVSAADDPDWPMYQHDPAHSGRTPSTISNNQPLYLQWAYSFGERVEVEAQPVISGGVIYQGVMNGEMHAINANTGAAIWIRRPGGPIAHTAAVTGNRVYFGSLDGNVYALDTADGRTVWTFRTGGPVMSAPAVVGGVVYIGSNDGNLYALNSTTGLPQWPSVQTGGPVISSPAVANGRVYFGSEDLKARCVDASSGNLCAGWSGPVQLYGAGMHNTHPVVSDDNNVVIFVTVKPGVTSYVPVEGYPGTSTGADPVTTWNAYYQAHPKYRTLYYLDANTGADKWKPADRAYVPMPMPYWGLLEPILNPDHTAWFPAPSGASDPAHSIGAFYLNHDDRLFQVDLVTGQTTRVVSGSEYQMRDDETGRHVFAGNDYYVTISEDLGVYRPASHTKRALFSNGDPTGYNFGSHMNPLSPLPSLHLWRYGGAVAMGGVPGASAPIVANNMVYFTSYSWLYAVGTTDRHLNPATSFPKRDARLYELTYPRSTATTFVQVLDEISRRVDDVLALGAASYPITARWEQAANSTDGMQYFESEFEVYGQPYDWVRVLSSAYPFLSPDRQGKLRTYLAALVNSTVLNPAHTAADAQWHCVVYGENGLQSGPTACQAPAEISAMWRPDNRNVMALNLYAIWAYANATGDWDAVRTKWSSLIKPQFQYFLNAYNPSLGFSAFELWRVKRLNLPAQIAAAEAVRNMAEHVPDSTTLPQAQTLLGHLLDTRVAFGNFVSNLYITGGRPPAYIRLNPDGTINNADIMSNGPYNNELIPYSAAVRDQNTDPSQLNWWDGTSCRTGYEAGHCQTDAGLGFMHFPALSGYFPLTPELSARLRRDLLEKTRYYVKSYEVNQPWWWMADLAHHTTGSGEHLYESPTLSWTMFQVKARVLKEDWATLTHELPAPTSFNSRYDIYRLDNLVTLLETAAPNLTPSAKTASRTAPRTGETFTYNITLVSSGAPIPDTVFVTDTVPAGLQYVPGSLSATLGEVDDTAAPVLYWSGVLSDTASAVISYQAQVTTSAAQAINNTATISSPAVGTLTRSAMIIANGKLVYLPEVMK